jgi:pimeloyl-ACP methyl ester carboxylesterase
MPYLDLPGVHLWFTDTGGSGIPVVFLHAMSGTSDSWEYQRPDFTAAGYRCIAYDRRNWGRSRPDPAGEQPGNVGDDLQGLVDHLGLERFHLVATAAGGIVGLDYALTWPERLRSLVLSTTIGGVQDPEYLAVQHRLRPEPIQALSIELRELGASYRGINPEGTRRWIEIERASVPAGGHGPAQHRRNDLRLALLETLQVPTLVLAGEADILAPPALMRMLAASIPTSEYRSVPEAGHAAFWERPDVWNRTVLEFLSQH